MLSYRPGGDAFSKSHPRDAAHPHHGWYHLSCLGTICHSAAAHVHRYVPCIIFICHCRVVTAANRCRRANEHTLADPAVCHIDDRRGVGFHHRIGICLPRSCAFDEELHHGLLEPHRRPRQPSRHRDHL